MSTHINYDSVAEIYDLYVATDYDFSFYVQYIENTPGPVLELTSGTGRLSIPLIEAGARLACVDISRAMLDVLARKLEDKGLDAELICADICRFEHRDRFALALLPFQSFMEIVGEERQRQALAAVHACLAPGGRFICTMHNPHVRRRQVDGQVHTVGRYPFNDGMLVVTGIETGGDPVVQRRQFFEIFDSDGQLRSRHVLPMEFELIEKDHFHSMASQAGFHVVDLYGNYDRSSFDPSGSPVMIWVLQKDLSRFDSSASVQDGDHTVAFGGTSADTTEACRSSGVSREAL